MDFMNHQQMTKKYSNMGLITTAVSVLVCALVMWFAFSPILSTDSKDEVEVGRFFGRILMNSANIDYDDEDEVEEIEDVVDDLYDIEELDVFSLIDIVKAYVSFSNDIENDCIGQYVYAIISATALLVALALVIITCAIYLLQALIELLRRKCHVADASGRVANLTGLWAVVYGAGEMTNYICEGSYGNGIEKIGMLLIGMVVLCAVLGFVADANQNIHRQIPGRVISVVIFALSLYGLQDMKSDALEMEIEENITYLSEYGYESDSRKNSDSIDVSLADMAPVAGMSLVEVVDETFSDSMVSTLYNDDKADDYVEAVVDFGIDSVVAVMMISLLVIMYTVTMSNHAEGMCGKKTSAFMQCFCSVVAIVAVIFAMHMYQDGWQICYEGQTDIFKVAIEEGLTSTEYETQVDFEMKSGFYTPIIVNVLIIVLSIVKVIFDVQAKKSLSQSASAMPNMYGQQMHMGNPYGQQMQTGNPYGQQMQTGNPYGQQMHMGNPYGQQTQTEEYIHCHNCGAQNRSGITYCAFCGHVLQQNNEYQ